MRGGKGGSQSHSTLSKSRGDMHVWCPVPVNKGRSVPDLHGGRSTYSFPCFFLKRNLEGRSYGAILCLPEF